MAGADFKAFIKTDEERGRKIFEEQGWLVK